MNEITLIGGPFDGQRRPRPTHGDVLVLTYHERRSVVFSLDEVITSSAERHAYHLEKLQTGHRVWWLGRHESLTMEQATDRLVLGYRKQEERP